MRVVYVWYFKLRKLWRIIMKKYQSWHGNIQSKFVFLKNTYNRQIHCTYTHCDLFFGVYLSIFHTIGLNMQNNNSSKKWVFITYFFNLISAAFFVDFKHASAFIFLNKII